MSPRQIFLIPGESVSNLALAILEFHPAERDPQLVLIASFVISAIVWFRFIKLVSAFIMRRLGLGNL